MGVRCATDNAEVNRTHVVLLALLAGLALGGVGLAVDFTGYWNCDSWVQSCTVSMIWFAVVLVAPWLFSIVLLARSRSISVFSCVALATSEGGTWLRGHLPDGLARCVQHPPDVSETLAVDIARGLVVGEPVQGQIVVRHLLDAVIARDGSEQ
jgi:hypothetical protein